MYTLKYYNGNKIKHIQVYVTGNILDTCIVEFVRMDGTVSEYCVHTSSQSILSNEEFVTIYPPSNEFAIRVSTITGGDRIGTVLYFHNNTDNHYTYNLSTNKTCHVLL